MPSIATLENVSKSFGKKAALRNLNLEIPENKCVALLGMNGAGKSTIVHLLAGLLYPNEGSIYVFDKKLSENSYSYKRRIGTLLSKDITVESFNALEYLNFVCKFQKVPANDIHNRIESVLHELNFEDIDTPLARLSSGNKKKIAIAAAIIHKPEFIILDEPFTNLDLRTTHQLVTIINELKNLRSILICTHNYELAYSICDEFIVIERGKLLFRESKKNVGSSKILQDKILVKLNKLSGYCTS